LVLVRACTTADVLSPTDTVLFVLTLKVSPGEACAADAATPTRAAGTVSSTATAVLRCLNPRTNSPEISTSEPARNRSR
jgi:hypothetical protein